MDALIRQLAVLAAVWALCELLLPDGRQQRMVRMAVSLMVTAAFVTTLGRVLRDVPATPQTAPAMQTAASGPSGYERIALVSLANQVESYCVRMARRAGYQADASVYLYTDGAVQRIELWLARGGEPPLMDEAALSETIAHQLSLDSQQVGWQPAYGEADR